MIRAIFAVGLFSVSVSAFANYPGKGLSTSCGHNEWYLDTGLSAKSMRIDFVGRSSVYGEDVAFSAHLDLNGTPNVHNVTSLYSTTQTDVTVENIDNKSFSLSLGAYVNVKMTQTLSGMKVELINPSWVEGCFTTLTW